VEEAKAGSSLRSVSALHRVELNRSGLEAKIREAGMIVGSATEGPMIFAFVFANGQVVDAGDPAAHVAIVVKFPVLISVGAEPVPGIIVPFVGESDGDAILLEGPNFFDEAIIEFLVPFAGEELHDGVATREEFGTVAPDGIDGVGQRDSLGVASVPGVFGQANFLDGGLGVEGRERRARGFHTVSRLSWTVFAEWNV